MEKEHTALQSNLKGEEMSKELDQDTIIIDEKNGLIFNNEEELYAHFEADIKVLEGLFFQWHREMDIVEEEFHKYEPRLTETLERPDEIWEHKGLLQGKDVSVFIKVFDWEGAKSEQDVLYYIALCYLTDEMPSFIYLHFPSRDLDLVEKFREGELQYSKAMEDIPPGAVEGDALFEGDDLAHGLYESMIKVRSESDIDEDRFADFAQYREETVEGADEIWRKEDGMGNILVSFIREIHDDEEESELFYIVVTVEDGPSNTHSLLFSFPTKDVHLVDRYRIGDNLQAEEVVQESSH